MLVSKRLSKYLSSTKNDTTKSDKTLDSCQLNAEQDVKLATFVSRQPATAGHTLSETKNSYHIIHGHYPII